MYIRRVTPNDFSRLAEIYRHHVLHGTATFELVAPDEKEIARRVEGVAARELPWLVAESEGRVVGYGYADFYRMRPAYRFAVEDSVYLDPEWYGRGIGRRLLDGVIEYSIQAGCRQMVAVIGDSENKSSIALHRAAGFTLTGVLENVGFKFGRWLDTVIMQLRLGDGADSTPAHASSSEDGER